MARLPKIAYLFNPREVKTAEDAKRIIEERQLSHVKVGIFDIDGVMLGKYMSRNKFFSALDDGFAFCDVVLGWDTKDKLYDNVKYTGWHTGYPDANVRIIPSSCRELVVEDNQSHKLMIKNWLCHEPYGMPHKLLKHLEPHTLYLAPISCLTCRTRGILSGRSGCGHCQ